MKKSVWLAALLTAGLILSYGCGGSEDGWSGSEVTTTTASKTSTTTVATTTLATTTVATSTTTTTASLQVLTNPSIPPGEGRDEKVRWQNYEGEVAHYGRTTAIKWPNTLYTALGCRADNTRCFVDGTEFTFYAIDEYATGALMLSYGCSTRSDVEFPSPFVAVLFKDGVPYCACEFANPMIDNDLVSPPATIVLPEWVNNITL